MSDFLLRLRALFLRRRAERDLDDEISFHLEMETRKHVAAGMPPEQAARAARLRFGTQPSAVKDYVRDQHRIGFLETLFADIRYAVRGFRRAPLFALTVIGTIAIGLGWNTAAFTVFNAYMLRPIDARDPYSLYGIGWGNRDGDANPFVSNRLDDLRREHPGMTAIAAIYMLRTRLDGRFANCTLVDGEYFRMLGINPAMGRVIGPADDYPGSNLAVLSYGAWQNRFDSAVDIVGQGVVVQGHPFTIIGVMPEGFSGLGHGFPDIWAPLGSAAAFGVPGAAGHPPNGLASNPPMAVNLAGRLAPGVRKEQAQAALTAWIQRLALEHSPYAQLQSLATLVPLSRRVVGPFVSVGVVFFLVLLSACANVANLMLARAMARQREIGIRLSLGAARARLIRQLLTESALLAIPSAALAFILSQAFLAAASRLLLATVPPAFLDQAHFPSLAPDIHVFWFMIGAAAVVSVLFGLAPALQATRLDVMQAVRGDFSSEFRPARMRSALVIAQVTVCGFLLICSAVLLRRSNHLETLDPGIRTPDVFEIYVQPEARTRAIAALRAQREAEFIAASSDPALEGALPIISASATAAAAGIPIAYRYASPEYFQALEIPLLRGRAFSQGEGRSDAAVVVVSESAAIALWPGQDPLGKSLAVTPPAKEGRSGLPPRFRSAQVIGVVRDSVVGSLDNLNRSSLFFPCELEDPRSSLLVRIHGDPTGEARRLNDALEAAAPGVVQDIHVLKDYVDSTVWSYRLGYWISTALGAIALLLTISGIYAVLSYVVAQRTKELGIRMAIGASSSTAVQLVLQQCLKLALVGVAAGALIGFAAARLLSAISEDMAAGTLDPVAYGGGIAVVLAASLAAAAIPALRAARVDPVAALRCD